MRIKNLLIFLAIAAAIAFGAYYYRQSASDNAAQAGGGPGGAGPRGGPRVRTVTVSSVKAEVGEVNERLLLTGSLKPKEQVDVTPKSTGRVETINYHVGDSVNVGDLIAELDRDEILQQVRRAEAAIEVGRANLAQREAELTNAETMLDRAQQLESDGLISPQDFEMQKTQAQVVRSQVELAKAQVSQAEAELRELKIRVEQTQILAPINGQIAIRYADVGALLGPNTPIVRIVNLTTMVTAANVPERDVGKLRVGNEAVVHVDAFGDRDFRGRVARISPVLDAATRSASIEIEILNPNNLLKAEMFARVELDLATTRRATLIPREALVYRGTQSGVYLINGNRPEFRAIETGLTQEDKVEVLSKLEPGTEIVGRGSTMLSEGDLIRVPGRGGPGGGAPGGQGTSANADASKQQMARAPESGTAKAESRQ